MPQKTKTKILATIGPSSSTREQIEKLIDAGVDGFRFNFSHGTHEEHKERYDIVRKLSDGADVEITFPDEKGQLTIASGRSKFSLSTMKIFRLFPVMRSRLTL